MLHDVIFLLHFGALFTKETITFVKIFENFGELKLKMSLSSFFHFLHTNCTSLYKAWPPTPTYKAWGGGQISQPPPPPYLTFDRDIQAT